MDNVILKNVRPFVNGKLEEATNVALVDGVWRPKERAKSKAMALI